MFKKLTPYHQYLAENYSDKASLQIYLNPILSFKPEID
jgi:hypothetical protein